MIYPCSNTLSLIYSLYLIILFFIYYFFKEILVQDLFFRKYSVNHKSIWIGLFMSSTSDEELRNVKHFFIIKEQEEIKREVNKMHLENILHFHHFNQNVVFVQHFDDRVIISFDFVKWLLTSFLRSLKRF